ncbi:MAG: hypothetical protein KDJ45_16640 [Hyphomicrobiaceae bacterium]|nr:hypothetical protein [Hyphomicrobiaceae bacterium]MCC0010423.1 hypothetical protein [Hyphomicrobiaceae bacterium]
MLKTKAAALFIAVTALFAVTPGAKANDIDNASATISEIEQDLGTAHMYAERFYQEAGRAQEALQWHVRLEHRIGAEMNRYQCARPANPAIWQYCATLYRDLQETARRSQYFDRVVAINRANHQAAVRQIAQLDQAGHVWKTHLAMLKGEHIVVASTD